MRRSPKPEGVKDLAWIHSPDSRRNGTARPNQPGAFILQDYLGAPLNDAQIASVNQHVNAPDAGN
jgi:hypothetical protein